MILLLAAAFAIYAMVVQRVRITRRFTLTGPNAVRFGVTLLLLVLPLHLTLSGALAGILPPAVLANPFAGRLITIGAVGAFVVLLAHAFRDRQTASATADPRNDGVLLHCGQRVRVAATYHWARLATGVIKPPPRAVRALGNDDWSDCSRLVAGRNGSIRFWWVRFDVPRMDADGDGPYEGGEIAEHYLEAVAKSDA